MAKGFKYKKKRFYNPDADAAIKAAQKGNCKLAFRHLHDAAPHNQANPGSPEYDKAKKAYMGAAVVYDGFCAKGKTGRYRQYDLQGTAKKWKRR